LPPPPPQRTVLAPFNAYGSSMAQRATKHAADLIGLEGACTLPGQSRLPKCLGGGSRTSKSPYGPADISALLPDAGWLSCHVRPHQREVGALAGGVMSLTLNPYPPCYRAAFACSLLLYPLPCQVPLQVPFRCKPRRRTTGLPRSAGETGLVV
jgi:hypothetical protein